MSVVRAHAVRLTLRVVCSGLRVLVAAVHLRVLLLVR